MTDADADFRTRPTAAANPALRAASRVIRAGLGLTVLAALIPVVAQLSAGALDAHVRHAYPGNSPAQVDEQATALVVYLLAVGVLGAAAWLITARGVTRHRRWARPFGTAMFGVGTAVSVAGVMISDVWAEVPSTILPTWVGLIGLLPCVAGAATTYLLWKAASSTRR